MQRGISHRVAVLSPRFSDGYSLVSTSAHDFHGRDDTRVRSFARVTPSRQFVYAFFYDVTYIHFCLQAVLTCRERLQGGVFVHVILYVCFDISNCCVFCVGEFSARQLRVELCRHVMG